MTPDFGTPARSVPRVDVGFLRRRRRTTPAVEPPPVPSGRLLDLSGEPAPASSGLSPDLPAGPAVSPGASLDLSEPSASSGASPELSGRPATAPSARRPAPSRRTGPLVVRARPGTRMLLGPKVPAVTLDRLQSGIGLLTVEAVPAGGVELACAYDLADGRSALIGPGTAAPPASRTPFLAVRRRSVAVDLRQVRLLTRLVVLAVFPAATPAEPGALVVTTWDGCRFELPLERPGRVSVPLSICNVGGELVLRAEAAEAFSLPRAACEAFGFPRISRLDDLGGCP
ncbi:hypothetical protein OG439_34550 [Amycolatopsis sp. NBC_01307]|uniref:hypothetical protein n=1 Tax=Amycolatopsis sp. NBC_01307 TaxID=2903561 RepID=UPI002E104BDD|nr:hypothetical protein OG439_34550 [Amycolatopsis sp. NBC_01307]